MKRYLWKILAMVLIISCGFIFISQKTFAEEIGGQVTEENQLGGGIRNNPDNELAGKEDLNASDNSINKLNLKETKLTNLTSANEVKPFKLMEKSLGQDDSAPREVGNYDTLFDAIEALGKYVNNKKTHEYVLYVMKDCTKTENEALYTVNNLNLTIKSFGDSKSTIKAESNNRVNPMMFSFINSNIKIENIILDGDEKINCFDLTDNSQVTIGKGAIIQNFKEGSDGGSDFNAPIEIRSGKLIIEDESTIKNNNNNASNKKAYGIIHVDKTGELEIMGGNFENNASKNFGGLIKSFGQVNISGGTFKNNSSSSGGVIAAYSSLNITGGTFENNKATNGTGGAIAIGNNVEAKILNCEFKENTAKWGGAIYTQKDTEINNVKFESNKATIQGGAIYNSGKLTVEKSNFGKNSAERAGGAIFIKDNNTNENKITGTSFIENTSNFGGGIYVNVNSKLDVEKSNFKKNEAVYGAGISSAGSGDVNNDCNIKISSSTFEENKAFLGAGVFTAFPTEISSSKFIKNYADVHPQDDQKNPHNSGCGGALYVMDNKTTIKNSEFIKNSAFGSGGAISINGVNINNDGNITGSKANISVEISANTKFEKNEVKVGQGGAIYTIPYEYEYEIKDTKAYKNLNIEETTLFLNNKSGEGLFVPPKNYKNFTNLKFSNKSDVKHDILQVESLLNNYDINYKNEMRIITYDANGGKFSDGKTIKSYEYEINKVIKIMEAPTREGYKFLYWKGSAYKPNDDYKVIDHHKFIAQWEKKEGPKPEPKPEPEPIPKIEFKEHEHTKTYPVVAKLPENAQTHIEYLSGYPDLRVKADGNITRAEAVTMLVRLKGYQIPLQNDNKQIYKDVLKNSWYRPFIEAAFKEGILEEKEGENFRPDENMTRGELAKLISHVDAKNSENTSFTDIEGYKYKDAIEQAFANKRITGYPDNAFRPDKEITRAETVTILNKLFDRMVRERGLKDVQIAKFIDLDKNHWAYYEIIEASHTHEYERIDGSGIEEKWLKIIK